MVDFSNYTDEQLQQMLQSLPSNEPSFGGAAQALFNTGLLHGFAAPVVGAPADIHQLYQQHFKPEEAAGAKVPEATPEGVSASGKVPSGSGPQNFTTPGIESWINQNIPPYQPKNETEKQLAAFGTFAPSAAMGPEALTLRGAALNTLKYGVAPTVGSGIAGAAANAVNAPHPEWAQTAAALAAPAIAHRAITPFPVTPEAYAGSAPAREAGVRMSPGQFANDPARAAADAKLAATLGSGTSVEAQNAATAQSVTRGAFRTAFGANDPIVSESTTTGPGLQRQGQLNHNEFNRLTNTYGLPYSTRINRGLQNVIDNYEHLTFDDKNELQAWKNKLEAGIEPQGDILDGEQYQAQRSEASSNAVNAGNPNLRRAWGQMRDVLDQGMRDRIQVNVNSGHAPANEVDAFDRARSDYQSLMIMKRAAGDVRSAATDHFDPQKLANATKQVISPDSDEWRDHPLGRYATSAMNYATPLPKAEKSGTMKELGILGGTLGAGAVGHTLATGGTLFPQSATEAAAYLAPAAAAAGLKAAKIPWSWAVHSDLMRPYLLNQLQPAGTPLASTARQIPPSILDTAAALNKQRQQSQ